MTKLFTPYEIRNMTLKNRLVMAPMCMYEAQDDGFVTPFHMTHYTSRAMGQVALIITEATAVLPEGRISENDLGIWSDAHIKGLASLVSSMKSFGAKTGIQLAHAGRKAQVPGTTYAPSALAFNETYRTPEALTLEQIAETVEAFRLGAARAIQAGFDVLEIHAAHGYLINEFLSPLTNKRTDAYGGSPENRYRILREIIDVIRSIWQGPLFVRISATDYTEGGLVVDDYVQFSRWMKLQDVDFVDVSSGAVVPARIDAFPLYQVPFAAQIKQQAGIATGAVGLITTGSEAEKVLVADKADLIFIGRELLRDPYFPYHAAKELGVEIAPPSQTYIRAW